MKSARFSVLTFLLLCFGQMLAQGLNPENTSKNKGIRPGETFKAISSMPSFPYSDGWLGGDGALSVRLSDTRVLWITSDSYVTHKTKARTRKDHKAFFLPDSGNYRFWPVWAFLREDTVYVLLTEVEDREDADPDEVFTFRHRGISLAAVSGLDREDPLQWDIRLFSFGDLYPGESFMQAGTDSSYLYVFKHKDQETFLTRIPLNALLQPREAIEYWSEDLTWEKGCKGGDRKILFTGRANGSLEYYPDLGHWLYIYGPNFLSNSIRYRFARRITGPWSESRVLYRTPEQTPGHPAHDPRHFCYLGRAHSAFYNSESRKLLLTYDCNSTEFFHAAGSDFIYIPRVLILDVPQEIK